jgi:hypothetical protein
MFTSGAYRRIAARGAVALSFSAALLFTSTTASADAEAVSITRVYNESSAEMVEYVAEETGTLSLKFEDAEVGLGEDRELMTDIFVLRVANGTGSVTAETKASTGEAISVLTGVGESSLDALGFRVTLDSVEDDLYTISITSESNENALSHVTFFFTEGNLAEPLYD